MVSLWASVSVSYKSRRLGQIIFQTLAALRVSDSVNPPGLLGLADPSPPPRSLPDSFSLERHPFSGFLPCVFTYNMDNPGLFLIQFQACELSLSAPGSRDQALYSLYFCCLPSANPFVHSANVNEYPLCAWTVLGTRDATVNQKGKVPAFQELLFSSGETDSNQVDI